MRMGVGPPPFSYLEVRLELLAVLEVPGQGLPVPLRHDQPEEEKKKNERMIRICVCL